MSWDEVELSELSEERRPDRTTEVNGNEVGARKPIDNVERYDEFCIREKSTILSIRLLMRMSRRTTFLLLDNKKDETMRCCACLDGLARPRPK